MSGSHDYHGRKIDESATTSAPPMPAALRDAAEPPDLRRASSAEEPEIEAAGVGQMIGGISVFPRIHFSGRYGLACMQQQEFVQGNLTWEQVKQVAWDAFGLCPKVVTIFDHRGAMIYRGSL